MLATLPVATLFLEMSAGDVTHQVERFPES